MTEPSGKPPALVAGTGFGCRVLVPALRAAGFDVVGLVGGDAERTRRRAAASAVRLAFTDLDEAIARTGAAVVALATPPDTHAPLTLQAIARGCHVLCEKPFALDVREAQTMLDAAERAKIVHLVGHEFRFMPDRSVLARAIAEGRIGKPKSLTLQQFLPLVARPDAKMPSWWFEVRSGGGWLGAHGSHIVDQVRTWLGEFVSLSASLPTVSAREGMAEDSYTVRFELEGGVDGVLQSSAAAWGPASSATRVAGTDGTLWVEAGVVKLSDRDGTRDLPVPPDLALPQVPGGDPTIGAYTRLCEALRAAMAGHRATGAVPVPTFADGVAGMRVLDAIRASAAAGGALIRLR